MLTFEIQAQGQDFGRLAFLFRQARQDSHSLLKTLLNSIALINIGCLIEQAQPNPHDCRIKCVIMIARTNFTCI